MAYQLLSNRRINVDVQRLKSLGVDGWPHLPSLRRFRDDLPSELEPIVLRALSYYPQQRFPNCAELDRALGEVAGRFDLVASRKGIAHWVKDLLDGTPSVKSQMSRSKSVLPVLLRPARARGTG
jgi:hypothetical protein